MRRIILSLALSALASSAATAGTLTPIFTSVFAGTLAEPNSGSLEVTFDSAFSPTTGFSSLLSGTMQIYVENPSSNANSSSETSQQVRFRYNGAPVTVPDNAFTLSVDANLTRDLGATFGPENGTTAVSASLSGPGGTAGVANHLIDLTTTVEPVRDEDNNIVGRDISWFVSRYGTSGEESMLLSDRIEENFVEIVLGSRAFTLEDGDTFDIVTGFSGQQSSGLPQGQTGSLIVDGTSTAQLGFVLPAGVSLVTQPGQNFSWVQGQTTVIPLPAGAWLLLAGLGALGALRRRG